MSGKGIPEDVVARINDRARVEDFLTDPRKAGKNQIGKCPFCRREGKGKGMSVNPVTQVWKCFSVDCGYSGKGAAKFIQETERMSYPEALRYLANYYHIEVDEPVLVHSEKKKPAGKKAKGKSFCDLQLESSGLNTDDVLVTVNEGDTTIQKPAFTSGKLWYGDFLPHEGDEMLIHYYDLVGKPVMYKKEKSQQQEHLRRIRWKNPNHHQDKNDRPIKYQSPRGSGSHLYIPERLRKLYKNARQIDTLFIQEGEKKAEKCCKHNLPSVGVMGIHNIGHKSQIPEDFQEIIERCEVKRVVFMLDSDWSDISQKLSPGDAVDGRPNSFFKAVKSYKEYMNSLFLLGIKLEIYFGYLKKNKREEKGIDDYLAGTLRGKEEVLHKDIEMAMHEKEGHGDHVMIHKITEATDSDIKAFWLLGDHNRTEFFKRHNVALNNIGLFTFNKIQWRFTAEGEPELAQPLRPEEIFWHEKQGQKATGNLNHNLSFDYVACMEFLQNRGFWRVMMKSGEPDLVKIEKQIVSSVKPFQIRDFVTSFVKSMDDKKDVLNMLIGGGPQYLGPEKLSHLEFFYPKIEDATPTSQSIFFEQKIWKINEATIVEVPYTKMKNYTWKDKVVDFNATILEGLFKITRITEDNADQYQGYAVGELHLEITEQGKKCDFLMFLLNTSNYHWKKEKFGDSVSLQDIKLMHLHLINKLTALGYLMHDYKNFSEQKAMILMDGMLSEVGASNGRSGKSLVGMGISYVRPQKYIPGKDRKLTEDRFIFDGVTEKTKNLFFDDVRTNFDFEFLFPIITGKMLVNPKGKEAFTLEMNDTPKVMITTNHAITGDGDSFMDRLAFMAFSDFYNEKHKPIHDFHSHFFSEWDHGQWNLFHNLMARCLQLYFRSYNEGWNGPGRGIVDPPMKNIRRRRLRQYMGEDFLAWAEEYFGSHIEVEGFGVVPRINQAEPRINMFKDFIENNPRQVRFVNATKFKKCVVSYCEYGGFHFNPTRPNFLGVDFYDFIESQPGETFVGGMDKKNSVEYFTVADEKYSVMP